MPFRILGLDAKILQAVTEAGYTEPTPIQSAAIPPIIAGSDLIGIAQTGTGKTAAFTLPILTKLAAQSGGPRRGTKVLIMAPTRELVVQIEENVKAYAKHMPVSVATVFGGVGEHPQIRALRSGTDVVIACPGRLLDLRVFAHPAENRGDRQRQMLRVSLHVLLDLHDEFARRRNDQHARAATLAMRRRGELREDGQREGRRLARARLRDADEVVPRDDRRDGGGLNRRRFGVTGIRHRLQNPGIKAKLSKWHSGRG